MLRSCSLAVSSSKFCPFNTVHQLWRVAMPPVQERAVAHDLLLQKEQDLMVETARLLAARCALQKRAKRKIELLRDVAFVLLVWACPSTTMCEAYLEREQRTAIGESIVDVDEIERRYLNSTVEIINAVMDRSGGVGKRALQTAQRFRRDFELVHWIETENVNKGIAPTADAVCEHMAKSMRGTNNSEDVACMQKRHLSTKWVQRFRRRCHMRRGSFQPKEVLAVDVLRDKVMNGIAITN